MAAPEGCEGGASRLDVRAEFSSTTLEISQVDSYVFDWSDLTRDGFGELFDPAFIDELSIRFYAGSRRRSSRARC